MRGNLDARNFIAFYLSQRRIDAVVALNRGAIDLAGRAAAKLVREP